MADIIPTMEIDYEGLGDEGSVAVNMLAGAMAGISEHAVMYPVDSIKVRRASLYSDNKAPCSLHFRGSDSYASLDYLAQRRLPQHVRRLYPHLLFRRHKTTVARCHICHPRRWTCSCRLLWYIRARQGLCRRKRQWLFLRSDRCVGVVSMHNR